ncbi:MAG: hydrogenase iron-sulfur subunit [Chloroflexota bacterium]
MSDRVLVIGGGIAGIQASLDLANAGARVTLVEREATIGGVMAVLDKNFPTLDCSICIEAPKMSEVELHPNIEILALSEVESVNGKPGDFHVLIRSQARFVTDACTRCGECVHVCPVVLPNEFDAGMAYRKAIHTPIPQSTPGPYRINMADCLNQPPNYLPCSRCVDVCPPGAIDLTMPQEIAVNRDVAAIIVATGYDMFDPRAMHEYGYGSHPDILTALEFERLVNSAGPTGGEIVCPSDGRHPERLLIVLCVGSRDRRFQPYCSRFCCMYSIKHAYQAIDHGVSDVTVLYMDVRAYGKGFDGFWQRSQESGAKFVRGRPARIEPDGKRIRVTYENAETAARCVEDHDMVVLANAVVPPAGLAGLASCLGIALDDDGFIKSHEEGGGLVTTTRPGIYTAGCISGPKDIPDSVAEGSGAAALALGHLTARTYPQPARVPDHSETGDPRVGVFVCHCGSNIAGVIDVKQVAAYARELPNVVYADCQMFSCAGNTQLEIEEAIRREGINRVVVAACSPKTHESIFRGVLVRAGLNPFLLEMANIRNMDSWVHKNEKEAATAKALDMVSMAVAKARSLEALEINEISLVKRALIVGGGIAGMTAAAALARQGIETHLVEKGNHLGGLLEELDLVAPINMPAHSLLMTRAMDVRSSGAKVHLATTVKQLSGVVGDFQAEFNDGNQLSAGAIIIATGAAPYRPTEFNYHSDEAVITNLELEGRLAKDSVQAGHITFISCVGSRQGNIGCARYCCTSMISQALRLRRQGKQVRIVSKDIRSYSRHAEELYEEAMRAGVCFFRYDESKAPQEAIVYEDGAVILLDRFLGLPVRIPTELLVLVVGLRAETDGIADQLKLARSEDGSLMELHPKLGPAETASQGVFLAGAVQGAKDVRESISQALATAAKAGGLLSRGVIEKEPLTARVNLDLCIGCMRCVKVCPYGAIEQIGPVGKGGEVRVLEAACMGCGTCAAECNFDAIDMPYFTKAQILAQIDASLAERPQEKCLVFTCNWCSYAGADLAGIEKRQYAPSARIIRTMCSARFEEDFITRAFELGAGAVLVTGCRLTETGSDCHYNYANQQTEKRFNHWRRKLRRKGIEPERLQLRWISAAEGKEFAQKINEMDAIIRRRLQQASVNTAGD